MKYLSLSLLAATIGVVQSTSAQEAACQLPVYSADMAAQVEKSPVTIPSKKIASTFGFTCLSDVQVAFANMPNYEFIRPGDDINNWKNLMTLTLMQAPQNKITVNKVANGFAKKIEGAGGKFRTTRDAAGKACFSYDLASPKGTENALGCIFRPAPELIIILQQQSRTAYTVEDSAAFLQKFDTLFDK